MQELLQKILTHARLAWLHRWLALVIMSVVCAVGAVYVITLPDTYEVNAKLHVDTRSLLRPAIQGLALDSNAGAQAVALMRRILLVRPNLEEIARSTDLDLQAQTPADMERLLARLQSEISLSQARGQDIFTIAYEDGDPQVAKRVIDAVINLFLERSLGEARRGTVATREFLEKQVKAYEAKLVEAEMRLKEFRRKNMGILPGAASNFASRSEALAQELSGAKLQLQEAKSRRDELEEQLEDSDDPALYLPFAEEFVGPLDGRIQELESRLYELLLRYTERHPDVIITRELIEDFKAQKLTQIDAVSGEESNPQDPNVNNPFYQSLKVALSAADAEVAALKQRVAEFENRQEAAALLVDEALRVETEYAQLNRDYGIIKSNYTAFAKRREQAEIGVDADQSLDNVQVRVIEPPKVPILPTGPERSLLSILVLVIGMGAGIGLAWVLSVVNPVFFDVGQLAATFKGPILGTVSFSGIGAFARPRAEVITYMASFIAVLVAYGGLIILAPIDNASLSTLSQLWTGLL
jgi:polysaccharide chain length determinant protein (PEP-CTERM system associated)